MAISSTERIGHLYSEIGPFMPHKKIGDHPFLEEEVGQAGGNFIKIIFYRRIGMKNESKVQLNAFKLGMLKVENFFLDTRNFFLGLDENSQPRDDDVTPC